MLDFPRKMCYIHIDPGSDLLCIADLSLAPISERPRFFHKVGVFHLPGTGWLGQTHPLPLKIVYNPQIVYNLNYVLSLDKCKYICYKDYVNTPTQ